MLSSLKNKKWFDLSLMNTEYEFVFLKSRSWKDISKLVTVDYVSIFWMFWRGFQGSRCITFGFLGGFEGSRYLTGFGMKKKEFRGVWFNKKGGEEGEEKVEWIYH